MLLFTLFGCTRNKLFEQIDPSKSGIHFSNNITDNDTLNVLDIQNIYNGGGIGVGDFNNDGLQDLYFAGNMVSNKLYLNRGDFKFQDITEKAGVNGEAKWSRGISVIDINNDGWLDIYVSASISNNPVKRENILYINKGLDSNGIPQFRDEAAAYNLNDSSHSTMAAFFDYDNDGDLDVYLLVNEIIPNQFPNTFRPVLKNGEHPNTDKLYRNDWDDKLKHPVFSDVSKDAGVTIEGYGHGVTITDINKDGWKDIYVTNDFLSNNVLYINNKDGSFTDQASLYFKHTSENSMGQDVIDINNDGLADVIEADMNPEDNYRKKMMMNALSYQRYQNNDYYGYQYQYVRNVLQINQGNRVGLNDTIGPPVFSDISFFAGVAETDWSWTPSVADFDNDGFRDIIITNGFPKDVTDHDFMGFRQKAFSIASKKEILDQIPQVKISNYAFKNNGDLTFSNTTNDWGLSAPTFSNGAVYADLDNDGDLDFVVNNINGEASLCRNNQRELNKDENHFLQFTFKGDSLNTNGMGTWVELYYGQGKQQVYENTPYRGYLSSVQNFAHFGLGNFSLVDSAVIKWPNGKKQVMRNIAVDKTIVADIENADETYNWEKQVLATNTLFKDVSNSENFAYTDSSKDFIDFNIQKLLPHKFSEYGPALAVGDVDADGLEDFVVGGSAGISPTLFIQKKDGSFNKKLLFAAANLQTKNWKDEGLTLFDADGDGDLDLYTASGGFEGGPNSSVYSDQLYLNDGKGNFTITSNTLPQNFTSKSCVRAADFDKDGDLDLFIAGRVEPWNYPKPVSSFIYRNDSKNGVVKFTDVTATVAKTLINVGMVCDAVWTDFNNDGWQDLVLTGEWMPIMFYKNNKGAFENITASDNITDKRGWWTSIIPGDFDNDGDIDYVAGNLGLNSFYKASEQYPVNIYAKDFDNNGNFDAIPTIYLPASQENKEKREYPVHLRDDMAKQLISFKTKFQNYKSYAAATFDKMFSKEEMKDVLKLQANYFSNSYIRNDGNGKFSISQLPLETQFSCMNGMISEDFDGDGNLDLLATGNDYGTEVSVGRYDACNGLFLKGDGKGGFTSLKILQSGWFVPGNAKALVKLRRSDGKCLLVTSENKSGLKAFELKKEVKYVSINPLETSVIVTYKNGTRQKREVNYGASFLSQSGRFLNVDTNIAKLEIIDYKGSIRTVNF